MGLISSYADDAATTDSDRFLTYAADGTTKNTPASNLNKYVGPGWTIADDTWTYSSYSSATNSGVINTVAGATSRYSIGNWIKFTQPTLGLKYGKITAVTSTTITVSMNSGYVLSNEAITSPYYSVAATPIGATAASVTGSNFGWENLNATPTSVTYNGNHSYTLSYSSDLTTVLSNGMRIRTTRTVAAPTQCASLNGTSQYFNRTATINGMTFTNNFVTGAWVKLSSYPGAAGFVVLSRFNGTSGWDLSITSSGQVQLAGRNGAQNNYSAIASYQSVPLNKWVHISAQLDMVSFSNSSTTSYITIDGVDVPSTVSRGGTNPTALVQAGNLEVGSWNGGLLPFSGKIAQAFVTSAKLTQTQVRSIYSQGITTADTATYSMVSAYSFNNSINDLNTTNANNLTANGSAVATNSDSPFTQQASGAPNGTTDYAIITGVTSTTVTCQVPEGCTIPTSGGVSAVAYSTMKAPYGFPSQRGKWSLITYIGATLSVGTTAGSWLGGNFLLNHPIGEWATSYDVAHQSENSVAGYRNVYATLSTTSNSETDNSWTNYQSVGSLNATVSTRSQHTKSGYLSIATATPYYLNVKEDGTMTVHNILATSKIVAEFAYL